MFLDLVQVLIPESFCLSCDSPELLTKPPMSEVEVLRFTFFSSAFQQGVWKIYHPRILRFLSLQPASCRGMLRCHFYNSYSLNLF